MSPRTGRPTDDPKHSTVKIRISDEDIKRLDFISEKTGLSKSDILRQGIREIYERLKK